MEKKSGIKIEGYNGTWYVIGERQNDGRTLYLLEHEVYGDEASSLIVDEACNVLAYDAYNGFQDYDDIKDIEGV